MSNEIKILPNPSEEQLVILDSFSKGHNVTINAVAGSGKTTTLFHLALVASEKRKKTLLVTYNKALQVEVSERAEKIGLSKWIEIRTIHSACGRAYSSSSKGTVIIRDDKMMVALKDAPIPQGSLLRGHEVVMIDEAQDLSEERAIFIQKISKNKQIVLVGDPRQNIYSYAGTTPEYFINAQLYFPSEKPWSRTSMVTSYRMPPTMANFVDKHIMGVNKEQKVRFLGGNTRVKNNKVKVYAFNHPNLTRISNRIFKLIDQYGVEEVAIIAPSIAKKGDTRPNPNSPLGKIIATLSDKGIVPAFVSGNSAKDSEGSFEAGRLLVSTWASMKGREKDAVVVLGGDEGYFRFFAKDWNDLENVPNVLYVAMTRARKEMVVLVDIDSGPLRTFNLNNIEEVADVKGKLKKKLIDPMDRYTKTNEVSVTDIMKHRRVNDIVGMLNQIKETNIIEHDNVPIKERYTIPFTSHHDSGDRRQLSFVGNYYGAIITELAEYELTDKCRGRLYRIYDFVLSFMRRHLEKMGKKKSSNTDYQVIRSANDSAIIKHFDPDMLILKKRLLNLNFESDYFASQAFLVEDMLPALLPYVDKKDKRREISIKRIIKAMKKEIDAHTLMEVSCYTDAFMFPYLATVFGELEWVDLDFVREACDNLKSYIKGLGELGKFEVPIECEVIHPYLQHLGEVKRTTNSRVRVKVNENKLDFLGLSYYDSRELEIEKGFIVTADPYKLSNRKIELSGRIDYIDGNGQIHEFKVASDDTETFSLQLGSYLAMANHQKGFVYNVATGKQCEYIIESQEIDGKMEYGNVFLRYLCRGILNWEYYEPDNDFQPIIERKDLRM